MQLATPDLAHELGASAREAFRRAGGVELARRAETDPGVRSGAVRDLVAALGLDELRPRDGLEDLAAAGEACRAAGAVALPYPIVSMLAAPPGFGALLPIVAGARGADHGDLLKPALAVVIGDGHREVEAAGLMRPGRLAPFLAEIRLGNSADPGSDPEADLALWLSLSAWWMLGAAERALELTVKHVNERVQFGGPLARLQSVRFRVADVTVLVRGLAELARYTAWRLVRHPADAAVDSLALRVMAQETTQAALRTAHQLHGATGFCDEHDLSVLSRHVQPYLRLPLDHERTTALLVERMDRDGFEGLFGRHR